MKNLKNEFEKWLSQASKTKIPKDEYTEAALDKALSLAENTIIDNEPMLKCRTQEFCFRMILRYWRMHCLSVASVNVPENVSLSLFGVAVPHRKEYWNELKTLFAQLESEGLF